MAASFTESNDELYAKLQWQPEGAYHVLATAWADHARYTAGEKQPIPGARLDQPMLWTVNFGKGRVFATALGHDPDAMKSAGFAATPTRGAEWTATGDVSMPLTFQLPSSARVPAR
jgi:type 1 glutamine amidotransferase